jgi:hypothetical protein
MLRTEVCFKEDQMNFVIRNKNSSLAKRLVFLSFISLAILYEIYGRAFLNLDNNLPSWIGSSFIGLFVLSALISLLFGIGSETKVGNGVLTLSNIGYFKVFKKSYVISEMKAKLCNETLILIDKDGYGSAPIPANEFSKHDWDKMIGYFKSVNLI